MEIILFKLTDTHSVKACEDCRCNIIMIIISRGRSVLQTRLKTF